jgi:hypothetical protein
MNIANISALSSSVKQEMQANADVENFVSTSKYFKQLIISLDKFLDPLLKAETGRKLEQSYIKYYTGQPHDCSDTIPLLLFAPLTINKTAFSHTWIARLPLLPNINSISIYFPDSILQDSVTKTQVRSEPCIKYDLYDYAIPIILSDFIDHPEHFLCIEKIKKRINS